MIADGFHVQIADFRDDYADLRSVRDAVFLREQQVPPEIESDSVDPLCRHVLARDGEGRPIGTGRLAPDGRIGRMAVLQDWRGRGVGAALLQTLLDVARDRRFDRVELHAQVDAIGFYQRFGFVGYGEEFVEAGIRHLHMQRELAPHPAVPRAPPPPAPPSRLVEAGSLHEVRQAMQALLQDANRQLWILSRDLDPLLLGGSEVLEHIRRIATAGRNSQVRVLVQEPELALREGHPLVALGQRLSSSIAFRSQVEEPDLQYPAAFLLNDRGGYLFRPLASRFEATADRHGPGRHRQLREYFAQVWERSESTMAFRALHL